MSFMSSIFFLRAHTFVTRQYQFNSILKFTTSMPLLKTYGKLINDHVTSAFYLPIKNDNNEMATVLYDKQNGLLNLHHTEVPQHLQGQGIGHDLAKEVFEYCSARNLKVILTCEFLQKFIEENPQYKPLVVVREQINI